MENTTTTIKPMTAQMKYYLKNRDQLKVKMREKYNDRTSNDYEFKQKENERCKIKNKERYHNDPTFRERVNTRRLDLYYKNKAETLTSVTDMLTSVTDIITIEIVS